MARRAVEGRRSPSTDDGSRSEFGGKVRENDRKSIEDDDESRLVERVVALVVVG